MDLVHIHLVSDIRIKITFNIYILENIIEIQKMT